MEQVPGLGLDDMKDEQEVMLVLWNGLEYDEAASSVGYGNAELCGARLVAMEDRIARAQTEMAEVASAEVVDNDDWNSS